MNCSYFVIVLGILVLYFADSLLFGCHVKCACKATTSRRLLGGWEMLL